MILGSVISFAFMSFSLFSPVSSAKVINPNDRCPIPPVISAVPAPALRFTYNVVRLRLLPFSENGSAEGLKSGRKSCKSGRNPHFCTGNINFNKERHESNIDEGRFRGGRSAGNGLPCRRTRPGRPDSRSRRRSSGRRSRNAGLHGTGGHGRFRGCARTHRVEHGTPRRLRRSGTAARYHMRDSRPARSGERGRSRRTAEFSRRGRCSPRRYFHRRSFKRPRHHARHQRRGRVPRRCDAGIRRTPRRGRAGRSDVLLRRSRTPSGIMEKIALFRDKTIDGHTAGMPATCWTPTSGPVSGTTTSVPTPQACWSATGRE